jgi:glutamine cyclotransferase
MTIDARVGAEPVMPIVCRRQPRPSALLCVVVALVAASAVVARGDSPLVSPGVPVDGYRVITSYPHDPTAFTQGLAFDDGELFEGTGRYGFSTLRMVDLASGHVKRQVALPERLFGEGITVWQGEIVQLTWRSQLGLRFDRASFAPVGDFHLPGEGWGITHDGRQWIISDGTDILRFLNPATQQEVRRVRVRDGPQSLTRLNELEFIDGEVWANIWHDDRLVRISPADGRVLGYVDLTGLLPRGERPHAQAVLNGIAYDAEHKRLFVTGKHWPKLFQIEVVPKQNQALP